MKHLDRIWTIDGNFVFFPVRVFDLEFIIFERINQNSVRFIIVKIWQCSHNNVTIVKGILKLIWILKIFYFHTKNVLLWDWYTKLELSWKLLNWRLPIEIGSSTSSKFNSAESGSNPNCLRVFGKNAILFHPTVSKNVGFVSLCARILVWIIWFRFPFESRLTPPLIPFQGSLLLWIIIN